MDFKDRILKKGIKLTWSIRFREIKMGIPEFIKKYILRRGIEVAEDKIGIKEGVMETKKWYQSKTIWCSMLTVVVGAITPISTAFGHPVIVPSWIIEVLVGMGLYSLRVGDKTVQ